MEFEALKMARRLFLKKSPYVMHYSLTGKDADTSGMICGGSVDILMEPLHHTDREIVSFFEAVKQHILSGIPGTYVSLVNTNEDDLPGTGAQLFVGIDGKAFGSLSGGMPLPDELARIDSPRLFRCPETRRIFFVDPLERKPALLIFGAGHISTCLAPMAKKMGFRISIIDDRAEYANRDRFPDADEIHVMPFELSVRRVQTAYNTHVAVVTRGHIHDRIVLEAMLHRPHAYLGMIGSVNKRDMIYKTLLERGFSQEMLSGVHAPIGLDIGAETPEEIAVSIIAEIIHFRAEKRKFWKSAHARNANVA
ncbi:XdhC family protein [Desulfosarcina cetonica]